MQIDSRVVLQVTSCHFSGQKQKLFTLMNSFVVQLILTGLVTTSVREITKGQASQGNYFILLVKIAINTASVLSPVEARQSWLMYTCVAMNALKS